MTSVEEVRTEEWQREVELHLTSLTNDGKMEQRMNSFLLPQMKTDQETLSAQFTEHAACGLC